jgi:hypothetical protein
LNPTILAKYLGMNRPILRVVNPWFLILLSFERKLTISAAQHPGESPTYSMISSFNRFNLASFCEPFPLILINIYCVINSILVKQGYAEGSLENAILPTH